MSTPGIRLESDFRARAKTSDVSVARLIGFEAKEISEGRATVTLTAGPQHGNAMGTLHGGVLCDIADAAMGMAFASTLAPKGILHNGGIEDQLLPARLGSAAQGRRQSGPARAQFGLCRM